MRDEQESAAVRLPAIITPALRRSYFDERPPGR
jgi:hypothetical protein